MDLAMLLTGPLGGALGLVGALAQKWIGMKEAKQSHEFKMAEMTLASQIDLQKADIIFRGKVEDGAAQAFNSAVNAQAGLRPASAWAANVLSMFRPGLTAFLILSSTTLAILFRHSRPELLEFVITSMFTMSSVATGYWFGVRTDEKVKVAAVAAARK